MTKTLNIGVIGLGRLGQVYAKDLAQRVPNANLVAVADMQSDIAESFASEYGISRWYSNHHDLIADKNVDAVAVITPTSTHKGISIEAAKSGKAIFCEKPISISLQESEELQEVIESTGAFFQMGFQRRFDRGYAEAKKKIDAGVIGDPVVLISTSRDPFPPPLEFCDPAKSGGLIADMGIHDFDVCRMFMGDVKSVYSVGGALANPEMAKIGDIDNAVVNVTFESGKIGVVNLSRNAIFGYDIRAEIWGTKGSLQVGYFRETPLLVMTREGITHDVVPHFMERFELAYRAQIQDFVNNVLKDAPPSIVAADGVAALKVSLAATNSHKENRPVEVNEI
ncbi:inositol 2-dehydrogenase [candidate division KSB1 bacterium]|nr:inositol 2-dehydrogenase [candidate division KSB1 bacterium]